jgi:hypothetical protein
MADSKVTWDDPNVTWDEKPPLKSQVNTWSQKISKRINQPLNPGVEATVDFLEGLTGSGARLVYGGGNLLRRVTGSQRIINEPDVQQAMSIPESTSGKVGGIVGTVAPYFTTGGIAKGGAGLLAKIFPSLAGKGAQLGARMALEGAGTGAVSAAQGSSPQGTAINTAIGTASPVIGKGIEKVVKTLPPAIVNNALRPLLKQYRFGRNPGRGIVEEGIVAPSMNRLAEKTSEAMQRTGGQIGNTIRAAGGAGSAVTDINQYLNVVDDAIDRAVVGGEANQPLVDQLQQFRRLLTNEQLLNPLTGKVEAAASRQPLTNEQLWNLTKTIGENTSWLGEKFEKPLNLAKVGTRGQLRSQLEANIPAIEPLSERYSDLLEAVKSAERRATGNPNVRMTELAAGAAGEALTHGAGFPAALTLGLSRTAPGATALAQLVRKGSMPTARTLKDLVAAYVAQNVGRNTDRISPTR